MKLKQALIGALALALLAADWFPGGSVAARAPVEQHAAAADRAHRRAGDARGTFPR